MAYNDLFRVSAHALIFDDAKNVLMVKTTYGNQIWTFPGGAVDPPETIQECLERECREELGCEVTPLFLSGVYYSQKHHSHALMYRCELKTKDIILSEEHSEYQFFKAEDLNASHRLRVEDCLNYRLLPFSKRL